MADSTIIVPEYEPDSIARTISDTWVRWNSNRSVWLSERRELRDYLFSTSTRTTSNAKLPWKNSTVTPKLTQIRDNLHANYMAALFPNEEWFEWVADDHDSITVNKRKAIEAYMRQKLKQSKFELVIERLVLDYIDDGNVFAGHEFVNLVKTDPATGEKIEGYVGPRAVRFSPYDCLMDPTSTSFENTPFIRRYVRTVGDVARDLEILGTQGFDMVKLDRVLKLRSIGGIGGGNGGAAATGSDIIDQLKGHGLAVDGFGSIEEYFRSGRIEFLEMWGNIYDAQTGESYPDHLCTIVDRRWMIRCEPNPSWLGQKPVFHCGWRVRPDNLWAQGPLDQLVGMQYRIDHLENLKADVFDQIANPLIKVKGNTVNDFVFGPGQKIICGDDGDVELLRPDATALNADMQIEHLMQRMEELAGAPKQAMGIRTPGEKTKYEVQVLENGAGRIFEAKVAWFEKNVLEPLINSMLEECQRRMGGAETIRVIDPELGATTFVDVTRDDLNGNGRLYPVGSRHFAEKARFVQELTQTMQNIQQMPTVSPHVSGKAVARALEDVLGWTQYGIVQDNVAITEMLETEKLKQAAQEQLQGAGAQPAEMQPGDFQAANANAPQQTPA
jgi:hypothetical protein